MTIKKISAACAFVLAAFATVACDKENASDVNQNKIYTDYEVFYNKNTDKTWVVARFRFGGPTGTILELDSGAYVLFNNDTLPYNGIFMGHYKEYAGQLSSGTFTYHNLNGQNFVNSLPVYDTLAFQAGFDTLRKSQAQTIGWDGSALAPNQGVGIFVGGWTWGDDALAYQDGDGATSLVLGINQMNNLPVGPATVYMDRQTELNLNQATPEGGKIRGKFRAKNRVVQVVN